MATKLVVLGIPWDVDTAGLRQYMSKFGELDDCIVMKERSTGRSRGFGYVTFASADDAENALESEHVLGNRTLEVKVATPKEEMRAPAKNTTRIFVARIPHSVTESMFRSYFETYGEITDLYMPKDQGSKGHRGIGFITFDSAGCVRGGKLFNVILQSLCQILVNGVVKIKANYDRKKSSEIGPSPPASLLDRNSEPASRLEFGDRRDIVKVLTAGALSSGLKAGVRRLEPSPPASLLETGAVFCLTAGISRGPSGRPHCWSLEPSPPFAPCPA
ncbi:DAZ-associated protein 1 [Dendrobium catenatum]|uniref:DAZ-associated protein 1 n=1 Tax=Dendrobium catenatum TaxID=906689 RepID=UPI0009F74805|nr:DAZ-associated protein 1 [Dendrobium catenatum]